MTYGRVKREDDRCTRKGLSHQKEGVVTHYLRFSSKAIGDNPDYVDFCINSIDNPKQLKSMDSTKLSRVILLGIGAMLLFIFVTKVLPKLLSFAGNIMSALISFAIIGLVVLVLIGFLKYKFKS